MALVKGGGLLALSGHEEILKNSSPLKPLVRFLNDCTKMLFGRLFSKTVREILVCQ